MANQSEPFSHLLSPGRIGRVEVRNRLVSTSHGTHLAERHRPSRELIAYHAARAMGGIGLIVTEGLRIHPTTRVEGRLEVWDEDAIPHFRPLADAVHQHGATIFAQLIHQGRRAYSMDSFREMWSASQVPAINSVELTHAMTKPEIAEIIQAFARGAVYMKQAGFDGVELHGAHGYLIHQFFSPLTNKRTDEYGGSLQNRARFALELVETVRRAVGNDFPLGMRLSSDDFEPGGVGPDETGQIAQWLEQSGKVDYLSISQGSTADPLAVARVIPDMTWPEASWVKLTEGIKRKTRGIPIITVGRIVDPSIAEGILAKGQADFVGMTRAQIADPELGRKLVEGRPEDIRACIGCNQGCIGRYEVGRSIGCLVNPEAGRELELGPLTKAATPRPVVVVGGGLAGMEAARVAASRGHYVALYERHGRLGGQVRTLTRAPNRQTFGNIVAWLEYQLKMTGVVVKLNTVATLENLAAEEPEVVLVATGSVPELPTLVGADQPGAPRVVTVDDVLERTVPTPRRVLLMDGDGHFKAASTAEFLADSGAEVHVVTKALGVGLGIPSASRALLVERLKKKRIVFHPEQRLVRLGSGSAVIEDIHTCESTTIPEIDLVVVATFNAPSTGLLEELSRDKRFTQVVAIGDCLAPRRALDAIRDGHHAGRAI